MKKLLLILAVPLLLSSCTPNSNPEQTSDDSQYSPTSYAQISSAADTENDINSESPTSGSASSETEDSSDTIGDDYDPAISKLIDDNPIDKDAMRMPGSQGNDYEIVSFYDMLIDNWKSEMNYQYNVLLGKLSDSAKQYLIKSQNSWKDYYEADDQAYIEQNSEAFNATIIKMEFLSSEYRKYKYRTIEMMNMIYLIDGSIKFNYTSK